MMFLLGYIGAPPTILVISAKAGATNVGAAMATLGGERRGEKRNPGVHGVFLSVRFETRSWAKRASIGTSWLRGAFAGVSDPPKKISKRIADWDLPKLLRPRRRTVEKRSFL